MTADRNGTWRAVFDRQAIDGRAAGFHRNLKWEIELLVDGKSVHRGTAVVGANGIAIVNPPLNQIAMQALSLGHSLEVVTIRGRFQYSLSGSADAIEAATRCVSVLNSPPQQVPTGSIDQRPVGPSSGTGLFLNSDGDILTNAHVVRGCVWVSGGIPGSQMQNARIVARDQTNDLALLKSNFKPSLVPILRTGVRTGEPVAVYGFPLAGLLPSTGNFTLGNVTATAGLRDDTSMLQLSASVHPGNSGGPVLDQAGRVVGIVVGKLNTALIIKEVGDIPQNVNFAIKTSIVLNFLEANGVRVESNTASLPSLAPPDLAEQAKTFTAFVYCHR
jgi:serine protease Do